MASARCFPHVACTFARGYHKTVRGESRLVNHSRPPYRGGGSRPCHEWRVARAMSSDACQEQTHGALPSMTATVRFPTTSWPRSFILLGLVTSLLALWKRDAIELPPYEDQALGLWTEASFLAESNFDYPALAFDVNAFTDPDPGPRSYLISIVPAVLAVLMTAVTESQTVIVVAHWMTLACAAGILVIVWGIARSWMSTILATLLIIAMALTPLFSVQIEMVGMDIPMTLFALLAARAALESRFYWAAFWGHLAFLTKTTGGVVTGGIVCYLAAMLLLEWRRGARLRQQPYFAGLLVNGTLLLFEYALVRIADDTLDTLFAHEWPTILRLPGSIHLFPDVLLFAIFVAALSALCLARLLLSRNSFARVSTLIPDVSPETRTLILCWSVLGGVLWTCSWGLSIPRYYTMALPFLYLAFASTHSLFARLPAGQGILLGLVLVANGLNQNGRFFPDIRIAAEPALARNPHFDARSCMFLERSREYLDDHASNLDAIHRIATEQPDATFLLTLPYLWYLTNPRCGYVDKPLKARNASTFREVVETFLADNQDGGPILFWSRSGRVFLPPPDLEMDEILYKGGGPTPLIVYRKQWSPPLPTDRDGVVERLMSATESEPWSDWRVLGQLTYLLASGRLDLAQTLIERELEHTPENPDLRKALATLTLLKQTPRPDHRRTEQWKEALPFLHQDPYLASALLTFRAGRQLDLGWNLPVESPELLESWNRPGLPSAYNLAIHALREGKPVEANAYFEETIHGASSSTSVALTHFAIAYLAMQESRVAEADAHLAAAMELAGLLGKDFPEAVALRGVVRLQQARGQDAIPLLLRAAETVPNSPFIHYLLGIAEAKGGNRLGAFQQWKRAEALADRATEPRGALRTLDRLPTSFRDCLENKNEVTR